MLKFSSSRFALIFVVASSAFQIIRAANLNPGEGNTSKDVAARTDPIESKCQLPSYVNFKGRHYFFKTDLQLNHSDASKHCQNLNMELVSIEDCEENTYLTNMIKDYGEDCSIKNYWTSGYRRNNNFYWGTEAPFVYTNWKYNEPNNAGGNENCVEYTSRFVQFNDGNCLSKCHFICESANKPKMT